jgi:chemotaxis response regulator CheB
MIRVLVVDDMFHGAFGRLLERQPNVEVVASAGSLAEAREKLSGVEVAIIPRGFGYMSSSAGKGRS